MQHSKVFTSDQIESIVLRIARTRRISDTDLDTLIQYIQFLSRRADLP